MVQSAVKVGDRWGFIDRKGTVVIHVQFTEADSFSGGLAMVRLGEQEAYIDAEGRRIYTSSSN